VFGPTSLVLRLLASASAALLLTGRSIAADASGLPGNGITLYAGYQVGGHFTNQTTNQSVDLREGNSFAASLDMPLDESSELQVFYNHQSTQFTPWPYPSTSDQLRLDYLQIGGTYFPEELGRGVYVVGGIGATRMTPDAAGFEPATRVSMNVGVGYLLPLSKNIGLRFEARGLFTFIGSYANVFCSGGCVASLSASAVSQGAFLLGFSARLN
jgi:hypothetical protein